MIFSIQHSTPFLTLCYLQNHSKNRKKILFKNPKYFCTVRYFFSDETQLRNGKMAAVYLVKSTKLLSKISYFPGFLIASRNAV